MVRKIMEDSGYTFVKSGTFRKCEKILFTSAAIYRKNDPNYYYYPDEIDENPDEIDENVSLPEGAKRQVTVNKYERNPQLRKQCIAHYGNEVLHLRLLVWGHIR